MLRTRVAHESNGQQDRQKMAAIRPMDYNLQRQQSDSLRILSPTTSKHYDESEGGTPMECRLAAILAADVVGFSALMEHDEAGTFNRLKMMRLELFEPTIALHRGRIFKTTGDGLLAEFFIFSQYPCGSLCGADFSLLTWMKAPLVWRENPRAGCSIPPLGTHPPTHFPEVQQTSLKQPFGLY